MKQINKSNPKVGKGLKSNKPTTGKPVAKNKVHVGKWVLPSTGKSYTFNYHATSPQTTASAIENYNVTRSGGHVRNHIQVCMNEIVEKNGGKNVTFTHNGKVIPDNKVQFDEVFELKGIPAQDKNKAYVKSYALLQYLSPTFQYTVNNCKPGMKITSAPKINSKTENPTQYIVVKDACKTIKGNKVDITEFGIYCENKALEQEVFFEYASTNFIRRLRWEINPYTRGNGREKGHPLFYQLTNQVK